MNRVYLKSRRLPSSWIVQYHTVWYALFESGGGVRLTREDWLEGGFEELREQGARALTIDSMCARLGVTKGSFYHHFPGRESFFRALLEAWEERMTDELIEVSKECEGFEERNLRLTRRGLELFDPRLEAEIRTWAQQDAFAREVQERVDRRRIEYLTELFALITDDADLAADLAVIRYAFSVGAQHLQPAPDRDRYTRLFELLERRLEEAPEDRSSGDNGEEP